MVSAEEVLVLAEVVSVLAEVVGLRPEPKVDWRRSALVVEHVQERNQC